MKKLIVGLLIGMTLGGVAHAGLDSNHPAHERAERFVCEHPRHAKRAHGLSIMPEACE